MRHAKTALTLGALGLFVLAGCLGSESQIAAPQNQPANEIVTEAKVSSHKGCCDPVECKTVITDKDSTLCMNNTVTAGGWRTIAVISPGHDVTATFKTPAGAQIRLLSSSGQASQKQTLDCNHLRRIHVPPTATETRIQAKVSVNATVNYKYFVLKK